jgi:putative oxidoreductase
MNKYEKLLLQSIAVIIGGFFAYKGLTKHLLNPCKVYGADSNIPPDYISLVTVLCRNNYLVMVGLFQILFGLLLLIPKTRLLGALGLIPVVLVIFTFHLFLDNRPDELVETGLPLLGLLLLLMNEVSRKIGWKTLFS